MSNTRQNGRDLQRFGQYKFLIWIALLSTLRRYGIDPASEMTYIVSSGALNCTPTTASIVKTQGTVAWHQSSTHRHAHQSLYLYYSAYTRPCCRRRVATPAAGKPAMHDEFMNNARGVLERLPSTPQRNWRRLTNEVLASSEVACASHAVPYGAAKCRTISQHHRTRTDLHILVIMCTVHNNNGNKDFHDMTTCKLAKIPRLISSYRQARW